MSDSNVLRIWRAAVYVRISCEDERYTLENQHNIVERHLSTLRNIRICSVKVDDGYSGLFDNRPAFQEMLADIRRGEIDCVAVRDLSRFRRDHLYAGRYLRDAFPSLGVRFISVFEMIDVFGTPEYDIFLMMSLRNLMNEEHLWQLSRNTCSSLRQGYLAGKYMGSFSPYGYRRSKENRHLLEPDPTAAQVVRDIFQWKLEGWSTAAIVEQLENTGIPSPAEYKKSLDSGYRSHFQKHLQAKWAPMTIIRILCDKVYTGRLEQGKSWRPHFKMQYRVQKPPNEWICVEDTHEAIIPVLQFEAVARLHLMDTRTSPGTKIVSTLAGFVRCKNCGQNMILRQVPSSGKKYHYYVCCNKYQGRSDCSSHRISKAKLDEEVFLQMCQRIDRVRIIYELIPTLDITPFNKGKNQEVVKELTELRNMFEQNQNRFRVLDDSFIIESHSTSELSAMRQRFTQEYVSLTERIKKAEERLLADIDKDELFGWIEQYKPYFSFESVTRPMLAYLVRRVVVDENKAVDVEFLHEREYQFIKSSVGLFPL